jgi:hypothetical protein
MQLVKKECSRRAARAGNGKKIIENQNGDDTNILRIQSLCIFDNGASPCADYIHHFPEIWQSEDPVS